MSNPVTIFESFQHGLIVSCQAMPDEPLYGSAHMLAMARAALQGGAVAIRANGPTDIAAIHAALPLPIIGLYKQDIEGFEVRITPTFASAVQLADAGADILAVSYTHLDVYKRQLPERSSSIMLLKLGTTFPRSSGIICTCRVWCGKAIEPAMILCWIGSSPLATRSANPTG